MYPSWEEAICATPKTNPSTLHSRAGATKRQIDREIGSQQILITTSDCENDNGESLPLQDSIDELRHTLVMRAFPVNAVASAADVEFSPLLSHLWRQPLTDGFF